LFAAGTFSSAPNNSTPTNEPLIIQDSYQGGVWTRASPEPGPLPGQADRPSNGIRWLPNRRLIRPLCAEAAASYPVKLNGKSETWKWWAELPDHSWMPMAAFQETTADGPYNLPNC